MARSFFESSIPESLHDAAQIDGLGYFGYFLRIVLPLSSAILAVMTLYYFVGHWNDFFTGLVYIRDADKLPLQNVLRSILLSNQTNITGQSSGAWTWCSSVISRTRSVRRDHRVDVAVAGVVSVPAEVFQQGRDDRCREG
nr:ABC transporter permease subunit [Bifidobacterium longum]